MKIKVLLADDHRIVREGIHTLLSKNGDITVVAEADNGRSAVQLTKKLSPDVVVIDIGMPDLNGIEATRQILAENKRVKVIALSMHSDRRFVLEMLKAGAAGYLLKDCVSEELAQAIRAVAANQTYLSPPIADLVIRDYVYQLKKTDFTAFSVLTKREQEVLQLLAEGKTTKYVAAALEISVKTVETHRQQVMDKLGIHSVAELTKYAVREGITDVER